MRKCKRCRERTPDLCVVCEGNDRRGADAQIQVARAKGFRAGLEAAARWKESGGEAQDHMDAAAIRALKEET